MSNWNVRIMSVVDLNINRWRGKPRGPAKGVYAPVRRWRWQFHSDVLVLDVGV